MKNHLLLSIIGLLLFATACEKPAPDAQLTYEIVDEGNFSYSEENVFARNFYVFDNPGDWEDFLSDLEKKPPGRSAALQSLTFDFDRYQMGFLVGDLFAYCCSEMRIEKVYRQDGMVRIDYKESVPGTLPAFSQKFIVLQIEK